MIDHHRGIDQRYAAHRVEMVGGPPERPRPAEVVGDQMRAFDTELVQERVEMRRVGSHRVEATAPACRPRRNPASRARSPARIRRPARAADPTWPRHCCRARIPLPHGYPPSGGPVTNTGERTLVNSQRAVFDGAVHQRIVRSPNCCRALSTDHFVPVATHGARSAGASSSTSSATRDRCASALPNSAASVVARLKYRCA